MTKAILAKSTSPKPSKYSLDYIVLAWTPEANIRAVKVETDKKTTVTLLSVRRWLKIVYRGIIIIDVVESFVLQSHKHTIQDLYEE